MDNFFIYLALPCLDKNVHNTSTTIYIHETEQEAGTPQQFTPITVGPLKLVTSYRREKKNKLVSLVATPIGID